MTYNYYFICNKEDFDVLGVPSFEYEIFLQGIGLKKIMVTKGNYYSILYDGIFLSINMNGRNGFNFEHRTALMDENNDIYLGVRVE